MNLMEWRRLAIQSVTLLLAVMVCSAFFSGRLQTGTESTVLADSKQQKEETKIQEEKSETERQAIEQPATAEPSEIQQEQSKVRKKVVVIDAGHGGMDEGTSSPDRRCLEKEYTLRVSLALRDLLKQQEDVKVYCTRTSDQFISKKSRIGLAKKVKADLLVSIHCNASTVGDYASQGVEVLYSNKKVKSSALTNKHLAKILLRRLGKEVSLKKRGIIRRNNLYLLHHAKMPTAIVEIGYITNQEDMKYIMKKKGQQEIAQGICNGILEALEDIE